MRQELNCENFTDKDGNPAGGNVIGLGVDIRWQDGPLGRGESRTEPNGAFVEGVIEAAKQRLEFYQASKLSCFRNTAAILHLECALRALDDRTKDRETREVEGTHEI